MHSRHTRGVALCCWLLPVIACGGAHRSDSLHNRCFSLKVEWPIELNSDSLELTPPFLIRLDTTRRFPGDPDRRITEVPGSLPSIHQYSGWRVLPSDSIAMIWGTGFAGVALFLPTGGGTLNGRSESYYDAGDGIHGRAEAVPIACDSPIPAEHRRRYPTPFAVPLLGGARELRIGAEAEAEWTFPPHQETTFISERVGGPYEGADNVQVTLDRDDRLAAVRMTYPDRAAFDRVVDRLRTLNGPPRLGPLPRNTEITAWIDRERWTLADPSSFSITIADPKFMW